MKQDITVEHAVKVLTEALRTDAELYQVYKEKVATAVMNTTARFGELEEVFASRIAAEFLKNWMNETRGSSAEQIDEFLEASGLDWQAIFNYVTDKGYVIVSEKDWEDDTHSED